MTATTEIQGSANDRTALQAGHRTIYNQIVQPKRVFTVSRYFLKYWLPLLGSSLAWLIVALQQCCYWNQHRNWCTVSREQLATDTGLGLATIKRLFHSPYISWFMEAPQKRYRYDQKVGRQVRDRNLYTIYQDDPLTSQHQAGLAAILRQVGSDKLELTLQAMLELSPQELIEQLTVSAAENGTGPTLPMGTVKAVVENIFEIEVKEGTIQLCELVQLHLTNLGEPLLAPQYFRLKWVPLLGPALGWLVMILRSVCYSDAETGERRDTYEWRKQDLARTLGQTTKNLANLLAHQYAPEFFKVIDDNRHQATFRVRLWQEQEAIVPADQTVLELNGYTIDPISGQIDFWQKLVESEKMSLRNQKKGALEETESEKMSLRNQKKGALEETESEKMSRHAEPRIGKNEPTLKHLLITKDSFKALQHHHQGANDGVGSDLVDRSPASTDNGTKSDTGEPQTRQNQTHESALHQQHQTGGDGESTVIFTALPAERESPGQSSLGKLAEPGEISSSSPESKSLGKPSQPSHPSLGKLDWQVSLEAAKDKRGRVMVLARLLQQMTDFPEPEREQINIIGSLIKAAGGGLPGALAVGQAIITVCATENGHSIAQLLTLLEEELNRAGAANNLAEVRSSQPSDLKSLPPPGKSKILSYEQIWAGMNAMGISRNKRSENVARQPHMSKPRYLAAWQTWNAAHPEFGPGWVLLQLELGLPPPPSRNEGVKSDNGQSPSPQTELAAAPALRGPLDLPLLEDKVRRPVTEVIWAETQAILRPQMTRATYDSIIHNTMLLNIEEETYIVGVKTEMAKEWLENRLRDIVKRALFAVVGGAGITVEFQLLQDWGQE